MRQDPWRRIGEWMTWQGLRQDLLSLAKAIALLAMLYLFIAAFVYACQLWGLA